MTDLARSRHALVFPVLVATIVAIFLSGRVSDARPAGPSNEHRRIALAVSKLMERQHLSRRKLDDEISRRCMKGFLKGLDPRKLFFYQGDIDEFMVNQNHLDDLFKRGNIQFAHAVFARFLGRVEDRIARADKILDEPHDFTVDEELVIDFDAATYPRTQQESDERWRKRVKFDLLRETTSDVEMEDAIKKLRKRYAYLKRSWDQTNSDELLERYLSAMTSSFDPHSSYMSPGTLENFQIMMRLELDGIGASLRSVDGYTEVHEVIPGGAADEYGQLRKGDRIVGVAQGANGEMEDIVDMKLNDVVSKIRGKRGTIVRLDVNPVDNPKERVVYEIQRARIELKNQEARSDILEHGQGPDGKPYRVGIINLPSFYMDMEGARVGLPDYKSTTRDVRRLLEQFKVVGVDAVVVDLRFNGGGSLTESVSMTGLFIDQGSVVQVKGPDGRSRPYNDPEPGVVWDGPLVVLINKFSASASEIFAGAVQDYRRGLVVGDHATHGKGTVQQLFDVGNLLVPFGNPKPMGALKMTIQQFYRPSGDSTQNRGVVADVELPSIYTHLKVGESDLDYAMEFDRVAPNTHDDFHKISPKLLADLNELSAKRINASDYFLKENRRIARYEEQKNRETVTLNKEKYLAEREELDAEKEEEETFEKLSDTTRPVFELDEYNTETLDIVSDYLRVLGAGQMAGTPDKARRVQAVP